MAAVPRGHAGPPGGWGSGGKGRRRAGDPARRGAATGDAGRGGPRGVVGAGGRARDRLYRRGVPEPPPAGDLPRAGGVAGGSTLRRPAAQSGGGRATRGLPERGRGAERRKRRVARRFHFGSPSRREGRSWWISAMRARARILSPSCSWALAISANRFSFSANR